ncbi:MAG: hypothetical protein BMS9Abin37_1276 [Acidobacteriota bacterium]|nr:MAG: hypothetical protein BMS9Abin37_1276 [Acidobacteriota bacterium]
MSIVHDLRQSIRALAKSPGFTAVAIATLGLGIGGSTAVFTVVDAVLLRPLNFAEPERLTQIVVRPSIRPEARGRVSPEYLYEWRLESRAFDDMAGWYDEPVNLTGESMVCWRSVWRSARGRSASAWRSVPNVVTSSG